MPAVCLAIAVAVLMVAAAVHPPSAAADPVIEPVIEHVAVVEAPHPEGAPPVDDGWVVSPPPVSTDTPDGWTLELSAVDETQVATAPLTTALSSRGYTVGGTFNGKISGPDGNAGETPRGVLEVGYQIGCGIDMSTSNGVSLTGTVGVAPSIGLAGIDVASPGLDGLIPVLSTPVSGGVTVGLKPGIVNIVPVTKKEFKGAEPWVLVSNFNIKIDGCVGQSFVRSYAFLTRSTDMSDAILAYYGDTKIV